MDEDERPNTFRDPDNRTSRCLLTQIGTAACRKETSSSYQCLSPLVGAVSYQSILVYINTNTKMDEICANNEIFECNG